MDDEKVYEVEEILDERKTKKGKLQYLIKWKGYSSDDNSWLYESNLFCHELLAQFKSKRKKKSTLDSKKNIEKVSFQFKILIS